MLSLRKSLAVSFAFVAASLLTGCAGSSGDSSGLSSGDSRVIWRDVKVSSITSSNFLLTLSATIVPPTVNGTLLAADDAYINGTNAYVSYNIPGPVHLGAIDKFSLVTPTQPSRTATTTFATSTVNGVVVSGPTLYAVGSTTDTTNTGWPALLNQMTVGASTFSAPTATTGLLNTYAGTGITLWNSLLYVLSGAGGSSTSQGLSVLNPTTLAQTATLAINDARGLGFYPGGGTDLFVIAGGGNLYDITGANTIAHTIVVGGNTIAESKSTVQVGKTMVAVSKGDQGAAIVCQADQKILAALPAATSVPGLAASATVTNAVAVGNGLLFAANGEAGVYVYTITSGTPTTSVCQTVSLSYIGAITFGNGYSANNLRLSGGTLLVATGLGGFQAVTITPLAVLLNANTDFM